MSEELYFGYERSAHNPRSIGIEHEDRFRHVSVIGSAGHGHDDLLWSFLVHDIQNGHGAALIDPTGTLAPTVLDHIPAARTNNTVVFDPADREFPIGFNPLRRVPLEQRARVTQELVNVFKEVWELDYKHQPLLLDLLRSSLRPLLDLQEATLLSLIPMLTNKHYRARVVASCTDEFVRRFWRDEFDDAWTERDRIDKPASVLTRVRTFLADPIVRNIVGQPRAPLSVEEVLKRGSIFIANLSTAELGEDTTTFLGALLGAQFRVAAQKRPTGEQPFFIVAPSCERLEPKTYTRLAQLSPDRNVGVVLSTDQLQAHQEALRGHFTRAGTVLSFRASAADAKTLEPLFSHISRTEETLMTLGPSELCSSTHRYAFLAATPQPAAGNRQPLIRSRTRSRFTRPRSKVEAQIDRFAASYGQKQPPTKGRG